jgi:acetoin utilization deacetylase AcuC-like enzyme
MKKTGMWDKLLHVKPRRATEDEIAYIHTRSHIDTVRQVAENGGGYLDMDTVMSEMSYEAALYAAGGVMSAIDAVMAGKVEDAACLVRPPGHHATSAHGMGFCLFNNVAIGARYLQKKHNVKRVLIVDWDVHHGNGTQDTFYDDPTVLFFSTHRYPFYPGSGRVAETGEGRGRGFTINCPVSFDVSRQEFIETFRAVIDGPAAEFKPNFVLVSAGYDAYVNDPIGALCLEVEDYRTLTQMVKKLARDHCSGRVVSTLEGGYSIRALPLCVEAHLQGLTV